jgi:hypothetical protein
MRNHAGEVLNFLGARTGQIPKAFTWEEFYEDTGRVLFPLFQGRSAGHVPSLTTGPAPALVESFTLGAVGLANGRDVGHLFTQPVVLGSTVPYTAWRIRAVVDRQGAPKGIMSSTVLGRSFRAVTGGFALSVVGCRWSAGPFATAFYPGFPGLAVQSSGTIVDGSEPWVGVANQGKLDRDGVTYTWANPSTGSPTLDAFVHSFQVELGYWFGSGLSTGSTDARRNSDTLTGTMPVWPEWAGSVPVLA